MIAPKLKVDLPEKYFSGNKKRFSGIIKKELPRRVSFAIPNQRGNLEDASPTTLMHSLFENLLPEQISLVLTITVAQLEKSSPIKKSAEKALTAWLNDNNLEVPNDKLGMLINTISRLPTEKGMLVTTFAESLCDSDLINFEAERYDERENESENIIGFLKRVYFERGVKVLPRPVLRKKDPKAYQALANWLRNKKIPDGMHLPKNFSQYDEIAKKISDAGFEPSDVATKLNNLAQGIALRG